MKIHFNLIHQSGLQILLFKCDSSVHLKNTITAFKAYFNNKEASTKYQLQ